MATQYVNRTMSRTWVDVATTGFILIASRKSFKGIEWLVTSDVDGTPTIPDDADLGAFIPNGHNENFDLNVGERLWARVVSGNSGILVAIGDAPIAEA
jgi:hypothetical protein